MSSLFTPADIYGPGYRPLRQFTPRDLSNMAAEKAEFDGVVTVGDPAVNQSMFFGRASRFLRDFEKLLKDGSDLIHFATRGNLSLHEIVALILESYGRAEEIYISTWSIKEAAARTLIDLKERGLIGTMYAVLDYRIRTIDARGFHLIEQIFDSYTLTKNHSKVIVMRCGDQSFTILTSANLSNNPRIEAGYICRSHNTYQFHREWMEDIISLSLKKNFGDTD